MDANKYPIKLYLIIKDWMRNVSNRWPVVQNQTAKGPNLDHEMNLEIMETTLKSLGFRSVTESWEGFLIIKY